jgi:hypothetical protein
VRPRPLAHWSTVAGVAAFVTMPRLSVEAVYHDVHYYCDLRFLDDHDHLLLNVVVVVVVGGGGGGGVVGFVDVDVGVVPCIACFGKRIIN